MQIFTERVVKIIKNIPEGQIMSYGEIAAKAGNPRAARQVSRILHTMTSKFNLPWHRVLNKNHEVTIKNEANAKEQIILLEAEGHFFRGKKLIK